MRRLTWFAGGFFAACLLSCYGLGGGRTAVLTLGLGLLCLVLWRRSRPDPNEDPYLIRRFRCRGLGLMCQFARRGLALTLGAATALTWFSAYTALFYAPALALAGEGEVTLSGTVTTYPQETSIGGCALVLRLAGGLRAPDVLAYGGEDWGGLRPGDRLTFTARVRGSNVLRGEESVYYTARGVYLLAYCRETREVERAGRAPIRYLPAVLGERLRAGIRACFDQEVAPLVIAVVTGDRSGLSQQLYTALNRSGVMHAAVVSGLHISVLVGIVVVVSRGHRKWALLSIPLLVFYAMMAGGTPSVFRAVIIQSAMLMAPIMGRVNDGPSSLGFALLLLLLQNPLAAASVSLQLSFASVAGLMLVAKPLAEWMSRPFSPLRRREGWHWNALWRGLALTASSLAATLSVMLFTVPLTALYFRQIELVAPLANLLLLPALSALMLLGLLTGVLSGLAPALFRALGTAVSWLGYYIQRVAMAMGAWTFSALRTGRYLILWLCAAYLCLAALPWLCRRRRQALLCLLCIAGLLATSVGAGALPVVTSELTVTVLDVGQGSATAFLSGGQTALVDCGGNQSNSAGDIAADYFASLGRGRLDLLVLTHFDEDHINGLAELFYRMEVAQIWMPDEPSAAMDQVLELAEGEGAEVRLAAQQQRLPFGNGQLALHPPLGSGTSNESGLFVCCTVGQFDVLITGDGDAFVERMLVKYYDIPDIELYIVGHHGSKNSTSQELLHALRPELAIISVGYNSYGHPSQEVLDRLARAGAEVHRTDLEGEMTVRIRNGQVAVSQCRKEGEENDG